MNTDDLSNKTVTDILKSKFGESLETATLDTKLSILEATAYSLRTDVPFVAALDRCQPILPDTDDSIDFEDVNEGLHILSLLTEAIIEDYSKLAAKERLAD